MFAFVSLFISLTPFLWSVARDFRLLSSSVLVTFSFVFISDLVGFTENARLAHGFLYAFDLFFASFDSSFPFALQLSESVWFFIPKFLYARFISNVNFTSFTLIQPNVQ